MVMVIITLLPMKIMTVSMVVMQVTVVRKVLM